MSEATDHELMLQVRDGDPSRLAVLFERYQVPLYNFFLRLTGREATSEDLVQDTFLRVLKARHTYREGPFRAWLYQVARSARSDHYRKRWRETELDETEAQTIPSNAPAALDEVEDAERSALLRAALGRLPEDKREVLVLSRFQDLRYEEIGRVLGCSEGAIKVRVHRAMKDLREIYLAMTRDRVT